MTFWDSDTFHEYERLCGDEPGTRSRILAASDWSTRVVDLSASEAELWQGVRKSYKALIHKAEREYDLKSDLDGAVQRAQRIHRDVSGRDTRPAETWELMDEWEQRDFGIVMTASQREGSTEGGWVINMVGYVYCVVYGAWSYYFSAASLAPNLNHALLWHAMKVLKARGVRYFELGWMARKGDTPKDIGISHFKAGFPGVDMPAKEAPELCGPSA